MIVPALLTDNPADFARMLTLCQGFCNYAQIDIMDGEFVPSSSIGLAELAAARTTIGSEAHLMVKDPLAWLEPFRAFGSERIIYHFEIGGDQVKIIDSIKELGCQVGLGVNPQTKIEEFESLVDKIDSILFLSVNPGFYGASFIPEVLDKIKQFKRKFPDKIVGIDGGIKLNNLAQVAASGVDYICVGSALLKAADPGQAYQEFLAQVGIV